LTANPHVVQQQQQQQHVILKVGVLEINAANFVPQIIVPTNVKVMTVGLGVSAVDAQVDVLEIDVASTACPPKGKAAHKIAKVWTAALGNRQ
jgi:hypothetical protein